MINRLSFAALVLALPSAAQLSPCTFVTLNPSCGPEFKGSDRIGGTPEAHNFKLEVKNAPKSGFGFLALGARRATYKFPGTSCLVFVNDPLRLVPVTTDAAGKWKLEFSVAQSLDLNAWLQMAFDLNGAVLTSEGLKVNCRD